MRRVLIADKLETVALDAIRATGAHIEYRPELGADDLPGALGQAEVLVVRSTKVTGAAIQSAPALSLIVRAGSGVNTIDVAAASARGIYVANCPGRNSVAVAELALGLMLAADRSLADNARDLREGRWDKAKYSRAQGLKGRTLGLVGFGAIAQAVAARALAFEMEVLAFARRLGDEEAEAAGVRRAESLEEVFREADFVSLHLPLSAETRGLIGTSLIGLMRPGAVLVNTARAEVVDEAALLAAARESRIRVATDVFHREPAGGEGRFEDPLGALPNVVGTHHIGASTEQAQDAIARETARIVCTFLTRGEVIGPVNLLETPESEATLVVRHLDRVGVLAEVFDLLRKHQLNVQNVENVIFSGGEAASARIRLSESPPAEVLETLKALPHVLHVERVS